MNAAPPRPANVALAVASGKGGVGKSTVSLNLALALADSGCSVGLLDADFYGPDIPVMVNLKREQRLDRWNFWTRRATGSRWLRRAPRMACLLPGQWTHFVSRQLVYEVDWGHPDYLVIDLPPGLADLQQELARLLPLDGAIVVVGPQDVAHLDARKLLELLDDAGVRVLGAVENMTPLTCPHCGESIEVFPPVRHERSIWALDVPVLARVPLDPAIAHTGDGRPIMRSSPETPQAEQFRRLAATVQAATGS